MQGHGQTQALGDHDNFQHRRNAFLHPTTRREDPRCKMRAGSVERKRMGMPRHHLLEDRPGTDEQTRIEIRRSLSRLKFHSITAVVDPQVITNLDYYALWKFAEYPVERDDVLQKQGHPGRFP